MEDLTKEDLDLVKDDVSADASDDASGKDDSSADAAADTKTDGADEKAGDSKSDDSLLGLDDDDGDADGKTEKSEDGDKSEDKADKEDKTDADWRDAFIIKATAGLDTKLTAAKLEKRKEALKRELSRYGSAEDYMLAGMAAREKLRSGEYRRAKLPDDATEEEVSAWRKENGIPEKPEAYEVPKINGHRWTDEDVPFIDSFKTVAHSANFSQEQMAAAAKWYADTLSEQQDVYMQTISNQDREDREETRDTLRVELGNSEFKPSISLVERLLKDDEVMPKNIGEHLASARYQDSEGRSRRLVNNPDMMRFLINLAKDTYGEAAMIPGDARTAMNSRKAEIEKIMDTDIKEYYRQGLDKELLEITERENKTRRR